MSNGEDSKALYDIQEAFRELVIALRTKEDLSEETNDLVLHLAEQLGYDPEDLDEWEAEASELD